MSELELRLMMAHNLTIAQWQNSQNHCFYEPMAFSVPRFWLVAVFGSSLAFIGFINNLILIYLFIRKLKFTESHVFYLTCLSFCDISVEISYVLIFPASILMDYFRMLQLYLLWHSYVRVVATIAQISITSATYMIVAASVERYITTVRWTSRSFNLQKRMIALSMVLTFSFVSKGSVYFELQVRHFPLCVDFSVVHLSQSRLAENYHYYTYWMFWFRNIFHVFVPFFLLLTLNALILRHTKRNLEMRGAVLGMVLGKKQARKRKSNLRAATRMLGAIVATYLITNLLNIFVTTWEHINLRTLRTLYDGAFYSFATDTTSLFTIFCGAIRLPIYYACNKQIRDEIRQFIGNVFCRGNPNFVQLKTDEEAESYLRKIEINGTQKEDKLQKDKVDELELMQEDIQIIKLTNGYYIEQRVYKL